MITFSGKVEPDIQAKIITKRSQFAGIIGIISLAAGIIVLLIIWLCDRTLDRTLDVELIGTIIFACIVIVVCGVLCIPTKRLMFGWNYTINFENETITVVFNHQQGAVESYKICKVKKVVDYGRYYYVFLYRLDPSKGIVCQKDLLTEGTIEEFEELFKEKIIRKSK